MLEITETTEMTKTMGIQGANHGFPKQRVWKYRKEVVYLYWLFCPPNFLVCFLIWLGLLQLQHFLGLNIKCQLLTTISFPVLSESVSTGVWCALGFGAGFEIALEPSKLQKQAENPGKGHFYFLRQTLVCTKPWLKRDLMF